MPLAASESAERVNRVSDSVIAAAADLKLKLPEKLSSVEAKLKVLERPYRGDICTEINVERYDLRKDGNIGFSHPNGTHDDVFWSIALAIYATTQMQPEPFIAIIPR